MAPQHVVQAVWFLRRPPDDLVLKSAPLFSSLQSAVQAAFIPQAAANPCSNCSAHWCPLNARPAVQAAFTPKELREVLNMEGINLHVDPQQLQLTEADQAELKAQRMKKRMFEILQKAAQREPPG